MARLDVYPNGELGYLLDVQTDILSGLNTRLVVPLLPLTLAPQPAGRLNPMFGINGEVFVMMTQYLASVSAAELRRPIGDLDNRHDEVVAAIQMIFLGF